MLAAPTRWSVQRLRNVAELRVSNVDKHESEGEVPVRLCNYVDVYKNDRITEGIVFMRATATLEEVERFRIRRGDVLMTKDSETWTDIGVPALVEYEAADLVSGYHLALLRPRRGQIIGGFLLRALQSPEVAHQLHVAATGVTRYGLSHSAIKSVVLPVPPLPDQVNITRFLDHADRRIRRAIRAKQKLIHLVEEQITVRASEAMQHPACVTERLERVAVQYLRPVERNDGQLYVALGLYNRGRGIFHKAPTLGLELGDSTFFWVEPGDLVISGQFAWEGAVALASSDEEKTVVSHRYYLLRAMEGRSTTPYLLALLRSDFGAMLLNQHSRGAAGRNRPLNLRTLLKERVPLPPFEAQVALNDFVQSLAPIRSQAARGISLMQEYRTRLIADVVTGKRDVREASKSLPERGDLPRIEAGGDLIDDDWLEAEEPVEEALA
jgi:type I restriction enzyme S subunit